MTKDMITILVAWLSLFVSVIAIGMATRSSNRSNKIARENLNIQHGLIEVEIRQAIEAASKSINDLGIVMAPLVAKKEKGILEEDERQTLAIYDKSFKAAIQTWLNNYDSACAKYIDGKIDKARFRKNYHVELRNLLEDKKLKEYFDPHTSRYKSIIWVYHDWEDTEK